MKRLSKCCNAKIDYRGGGYDGEDICPIEDFCTKCGQTLAINGFEVDDLVILEKKDNK